MTVPTLPGPYTVPGPNTFPDTGPPPGPHYEATVALSGTGSLTLTAVQAYATVSVKTTGAGTDTFRGVSSTVRGSVVRTALGVLRTDRAPGISLTLYSEGTLTAVGRPVFQRTVSTVSTGKLTYGLSHVDLGTSLLQFTEGDLDVTALKASMADEIDRVATGTLTVGHGSDFVASVSLSATGTLTVATGLSFSSNLYLFSIGTLSVSQGVGIDIESEGVLSVQALQLDVHAPIQRISQGVLILTGLAHVADVIEPALITAQPYYVRATQPWAVDQERQRHIQAIYQVGEPAMFVLMWRVEDYKAGLVTKCPRCAPSDGSVDARIAAIYQQPQTARCPFCFGTTFYGGVRAKIIRPAIFTDADEDERAAARGVTHGENLTVESTDDFRSRSGDYVFRQDGSRWQLGHPSRVQVRTGFAHPTQTQNSIGYGLIPAAREDESSVAFEIPPNRYELKTMLAAPTAYPNAAVDIVNGPLIPTGEID